jgi:hypothetical protein
MTEIESRRSEPLSAQPQENTDSGSSGSAVDLSKRPRMEDESHAEVDGNSREGNITSDLGKQKPEIKDFRDPLNQKSVGELKFESVHPSARSTADEQEEEVEQKGGVSEQVNGDPVSQATGNLDDTALQQQPDMDHAKGLAKENGGMNETAGLEATLSPIDNQAPLVNGSATPPLVTQKVDPGSPSEQVENQTTEHEEDPHSRSSHLDIVSQASDNTNSNRLPQALVDILPNSSTARPRNDIEDKLNIENSHTPVLANDHAIPQLSTKLPAQALPGSPALEQQNENSSSKPASLEGGGITEHQIPTPKVESSGQQPSAQKRRRKRDIFCPCFGEADENQHKAASANLNTDEGSLLAARNKVARGGDSIPQPNEPPPGRRPSEVPAPTHAPPAPPVSATTARLAPQPAPTSNSPSAASSLYDAPSARLAIPNQRLSYLSLVARFSPKSAPTEIGSETARPQMLIHKEDTMVEKLLKPSYNKHTKRWIAQFQENDPTYKPWNDLEKRQELIGFIAAKIGQPKTHDSSQRLWYADLLRVSKHEDGPWVSVVLIGCDREEDRKKLSNELEKEAQSDAWFLKDYTCRAEMGRDVTLCAVGSTASQSQSKSELLGTPIYGGDMTSVPTLCGQLCHIKDYNEVSGSLCTMGGVLHINQDFYVLTSAHPFRQETRNLDIPDGKTYLCNTRRVWLC